MKPHIFNMPIRYVLIAKLSSDTTSNKEWENINTSSLSIISSSLPSPFPSLSKIHLQNPSKMFPLTSILLLGLTSFSFTASLPTIHEDAELEPRLTKPYQIRGVEDPIYHLYLQALPGSSNFPPPFPTFFFFRIKV